MRWGYKTFEMIFDQKSIPSKYNKKLNSSANMNAYHSARQHIFGVKQKVHKMLLKANEMIREIMGAVRLLFRQSPKYLKIGTKKRYTFTAFAFIKVKLFICLRVGNCSYQKFIYSNPKKPTQKASLPTLLIKNSLEFIFNFSFTFFHIKSLIHYLHTCISFITCRYRWTLLCIGMRQRDDRPHVHWNSVSVGQALTKCIQTGRKIIMRRGRRQHKLHL